MKKFVILFLFSGLLSCDPISEAKIVNSTSDAITFISSISISDYNILKKRDSLGNIYALINPYFKFVYIEIKDYCIEINDMPDYLEIRKPHDTLIYRGKETIYQLFDFTNPGKKKRKKCDGEWIYYIR